MNIPIDPEAGYARAQGSDVGWFWLTLAGLFFWCLAIACKVLCFFVRQRRAAAPKPKPANPESWGCE